MASSPPDNLNRYYCLIRDSEGNTRSEMFKAFSFADAELMCKILAHLTTDEKVISITAEYVDG